MRDAAGEFDDLQTALHFAVGIRQDLAVLPGDDLRQFPSVALQQFLELEHDAGAAERRGVGPGWPGRVGGSDRFVDLGGVGHCNLAGDLA